MQTIKINCWREKPENYTGIVEYPDDEIIYYLNGECHREDGPAITMGDGRLYYYKNGEYHREDGPAVIRKNGRNEYYLNGKKLKKVKRWIKENNIPEVWNNTHKILFKLTFG